MMNTHSFVKKMKEGECVDGNTLVKYDVWQL